MSSFQERTDVTVIIPTRNRLNLISKAIESILRQTYPVKKIIVIDDASSDGTASFLKANYPRIQIIAKTVHEGAAAARNEGLAVTQTPLVAFLDSDDCFLPDKIEKQVQAIQRAGAGFSTTGYVTETGRYQVNQTVLSEIASERLHFRNCLGGCTGLLAKTNLMKECRFDEKMLAVQDWELFVRLLRKQKVVHLPEPLYLYSTGEKNRITRNTGRRFLGHARFYRLHIRPLPDASIHSKKMFKFLLYYLLHEHRNNYLRAQANLCLYRTFLWASDIKFLLKGTLKK